MISPLFRFCFGSPASESHAEVRLPAALRQYGRTPNIVANTAALTSDVN
jgi:hypothetical protein